MVSNRHNVIWQPLEYAYDSYTCKTQILFKLKKIRPRKHTIHISSQSSNRTNDDVLMLDLQIDHFGFSSSTSFYLCYLLTSIIRLCMFFHLGIL